MKYGLRLFAINGDALATEFRTPEPLLGRVLQRVRDDGYKPEDQQLIEAILRAGLAGEWPDDKTTDPFTVLCCVFEVIAEQIQIPLFSEFKHMQLLEDTGLLSQFTPLDSRIPLPAGTGTLAFVTVLANRRMDRVLKEELRKPDPEDQYASTLRTLCLDAIESLAPDGLDLYMIVKEY